MSKTEQGKLDFLTTEVRRLDQRYHGQDDPEVPDAEYDRMKTELTELETAHPELAHPDSPTQTVGAPPSPDLNPLTHPTPMLSLANAFSEADFRAWHARMVTTLGTDELQIAVEPKVDGLAVRLHYDEGRFQMAATRGDGTTGEDITEQVSNLPDLPQYIHCPHSLELRGEIYMPRAAFPEVNEERERQGLQPFANARNAAAGGVRTHDPLEARNRRLTFLIYHNNLKHGSHELNMQAAHILLFPTPEPIRANSADEAVAAYRRLEATRGSLDYETDGVVFKLDSTQFQQLVGATGHEPRWAIAWKWPTEHAVTRLNQITISHGRFGKLTPVAVLTPVTLGGVTIQSATLHNLADMRKKDIRPGEDVTIERAGEVIPQVTGPVDTNPNRRTPQFEMPTHCPACSTAVEPDPGLHAHWCPNQECPSRLPEWLEHFVSKKCMDVEHFGPTLCTQLIAAGLVSEDPSDIYLLDRNQLLSLDRMGQRGADRIMASIEKSKEQPLHRVLYSLGIYRLGRQVSQQLARMFDDAWHAAAMSEDQLAAQDGIGPMIAKHVYQGLQSPRTRNMLHKMEDAGLRVRATAPQGKAIPQSQPSRNQENEQQMPRHDNFAGKTFVVTGKLDRFTRFEVDGFIEANGGNAASSITANTDYLVIGATRGDKPTTKMKRAQQMGIKIISEDELMAMAAEPASA